MTHQGIRLRVSNSAGVILEADSQTLHAAALFAGGTEWVDVIRAYTADPAGLTVEIRPVTLDDEPDDEPDDDNPLGFGDCRCPCSGCSGCTG